MPFGRSFWVPGQRPNAQAVAGHGLALQAAPGQWPGPLPGTHSPLDCVCLGSAYRIAFGSRAGQKVFTVQGAMPRDTAFAPELCADVQGFSLHAAVRCGADDRQALEQLGRYIVDRPWPTNGTYSGGSEAGTAIERVSCVKLESAA